MNNNDKKTMIINNIKYLLLYGSGYEITINDDLQNEYFVVVYSCDRIDFYDENDSFKQLNNLEDIFCLIKGNIVECDGGTDLTVDIKENTIVVEGKLWFNVEETGKKFRTNIVDNTFLTISPLLVVLLIIFVVIDEGIGSYISLGLLFVVSLLTGFIRKKEIERIKNEIANLKNDEKIKYAENKKNKCLTYSGANSLKMMLFNHYVIIGNYQKAKDNTFLKIYKSPYAWYSLYIYYLNNKDYKKADEVYNKIINCQNIDLIAQKDLIVCIKDFIVNGTYNVKLETSTYAYIKKACADYKSGNLDRIVLKIS